MEINSMQLKSNIGKKLPFLYQGRCMGKGSMVNTISCRVKNLRMKNEKTNFYEVLSLSSGDHVGFDEIKKAYRSRALEFHPDVCPPSTREESTRRFVELREAYETLSDPNSRKMYDYELSLGHSDFGGLISYEQRRGSISKDVLEKQLSGLEKRSLDRLEKKKNGYN